MNRTVVVTGVAGAQQAAVARAFSERGWTVRGTSRRPLGAPSGEARIADLETGEGLESALVGADVLAVTLPQDHRERVAERVARNAAAAADRARIGRIVLNVAGTIYEDDDSPLFEDLRTARRVVLEATTPSVVLEPTVFMDNLLAPWSLPGIARDGVLAYPAPEDAPISWISHASLAGFVAAAATADAAPSRSFRIGGPEAVTGTDLARVLGARLGRDVTYRRVPLDDFAAGVDAAFGTPAGTRIASIYARLDARPDAMAVDGEAARVLRVEPESFTAFAGRQSWSVAGGS